MFIVFEGIDCSGKSTLIKALSQYLINQNIPHINTREPGSSSIGALARTIIINETSHGDPNHNLIYLTFALDRALHCKEIIVPALKRNQIVLCDRFIDSSLVYQGIHCNEHFIRTVFDTTCNNIKPDLTIYLATSVSTALHRMKHRNNNDALDEYAKTRLEILHARYTQLYTNNNAVLIIQESLSINEAITNIMSVLKEVNKQ